MYLCVVEIDLCPANTASTRTDTDRLAKFVMNVRLPLCEEDVYKRQNQIKRGAMVPFVYLRENRSVVKEHAMQQIFDKGPAKKSDTIDKHPDRGLRRV